MRVLIITAEGFEDSELLVPLSRLEKERVEVDIASLKRGSLRGKRGRTVDANIAVEEVEPMDYNLLLLPGGKAPAKLRDSPKVQAVARAFMAENKPIAAICHGPQILISAGLVKGRILTAYPAVGKELEAAGATYRDRELVVDGNLITSRRPDDLPAFVGEMMDRLMVAEEL